MYVDTDDGEILNIDRMSRKKNCSLNPGQTEQYNIVNHGVADLQPDTPPTEGHVTATKFAEQKPDGKWYRIYQVRSYTAGELATQENAWASQELSNANREVRKHNDANGRTVGTKPQWVAYRNALRDHVIGGVVQDTRATVEALKPT